MASEPERCPNEAQLFAFYEGTLRRRARKRIERHLAACDRCRNSLALLAREASGDTAPALEKDDNVKDQTASVLRMAERDEARERWMPDKSRVRTLRVAAVAAFLMLALGTVAVYRTYLNRSPTEKGFKALGVAVSKSRRTPLRISGGLPYAPYQPLPRGGASSDDLSFDVALSKLSFALERTAPPVARLNLARFYLARSEPDDSAKALSLLSELGSGSANSADILNDTGVANYQFGRYGEALSSFGKALDIEAGMLEALFNKAYTEQRVGHEGARQDWQSFIASTSDSDWIAEARERLTLFGGPEN